MELITPEEVGFSSERLGRIRPFLQAMVDEGRLSGLSTLIARRGKVVHVEQVGQRDREAGLPMEADTIFRIYSMTKPIVTVAAMMLYEEGHFQLFDPISKYAPAFKEMQVLTVAADGSHKLVDAEREITFHHLMTHTSGLTYGFIADSPVDPLYEEAGLPNLNKSTVENMELLAGLPLVHHPGTVWRYSMSTDVLGYLVSLISGMPLDQLLAERLFRPLGMVDTGFYVPEEKQARFAALYALNQAGKVIRYEPHDYTRPPAMPSGGGGLVSTAADYLQFAHMLLNQGELNGTRFLGSRTVSYMAMNHLPQSMLPIGISESWPGLGFGLGFSVVMNPAETQVLEPAWNYGWAGMASTHFWIDPQEELIGMILTQFIPTSEHGLEERFKRMVYQALVD